MCCVIHESLSFHIISIYTIIIHYKWSCLSWFDSKSTKFYEIISSWCYTKPWIFKRIQQVSVLARFSLIDSMGLRYLDLIRSWGLWPWIRTVGWLIWNWGRDESVSRWGLRKNCLGEIGVLQKRDIILCSSMACKKKAQCWYVVCGSPLAVMLCF